MIFKIALAAIYLFAGGSKVLGPLLFKATIRSYYSFLPETLALVIAILFPWVEILASLSLILNWKTKYASGVLFFLSLFLFVQTILNYNDVLPYGCGCFGFGGPEKITLYHVLLGIFLLLLSGWVCIMELRKETR